MGIEEESGTFRWTCAREQYIATLAANLIALSHGSMIGWVSSALPILTSDNTPLIRPLTNDETSWVGSVNCVGAIIGSLSFGYIATLLGSKRAVIFLAFPIIIFWLLIYFASVYYHILLARFIGGWAGGAVHSTVLLYIAEISNDDIRGRLGSIPLFLRNVGTLIGYILGASVEYEYIPWINVILPISFVLIFIMLPNTPRFYLQKNQTQKAEEALKFYKGYKGKSPQEAKAVNKEFERLKAITSIHKKEERFQIADFFNRSAMKGIWIGIALTTFSQLTCAFAITTYAATTLEKVGILIDPDECAVILALALIAGSLVTTYLADIIGRKALNLVSLLGSAFGLLSTALFHYLNLNGFNLTSYIWVPVVSLSFVIFISSAGIVPLSMICSIENLPPKIRTFGMAIISVSLGFATFISLKLYPTLLDLFDLHGCLTVYGIGCIIGFLFVLFVLKETKGRSLDDIGVKEKKQPIEKVVEISKTDSGLFVISGKHLDKSNAKL